MKTAVFPAPKGTPAINGAIQCTFGVQVHANMISPMGIQSEAMHTTEIIASGGGRPVISSRLCELMSFRKTGSKAILNKLPTPIPMYERPMNPGCHPLKDPKTTGYATKQRYNIAYTTPMYKFQKILW